jgi:uncharacterized phage protein gp47/JayE
MTTYTRPSFSELNTRITADLSVIPAVLAEPLAAMWARACHSQHGYLDFILAQCSPLTCDLDHLYDWAALYAVNRLLAVAAQGIVMATGTVGVDVLAGALLRAPNGLDYQVLAAVTLTGSPTPVTVRCTTAGKATNVVAFAVLALIDPIVGCSNNLTVSTLGLTGGSDDEAVDAWRLRVCDEWQTVVRYGGRSGKPADYRAWAMAAHPSVTGALVQPQALGPGTVLVRPICDSLTNRLPTTAVLDAVSAYLPAVVPAVADWRVAAPLLDYVTITLALGASVDTSANRQAITDFLAVLVLSKSAEQDVLLLTEIDVAVLSVTSDYVRVAPVANIVADAGAIFVLAAVEFE